MCARAGQQSDVSLIGKWPVMMKNLVGRFALSTGHLAPVPGLTRANDAKDAGNSPCGIFRGDGDIRAMKAEGEPVS